MMRKTSVVAYNTKNTVDVALNILVYCKKCLKYSTPLNMM